MKYEFKFTLNKNDLFFSSLYYAYLSKAGIFDLVFTLFSIFVIIFTNITDVFNTFTIAYKLTLIICPFIFTIIHKF